MILDKYEEVEEIQHRGYSATCIVQDRGSSTFFAKWLKGIKKGSQASKILSEKIRFLKKARHEALPQLIEFGWDEQEEAYCTVFELLKAVPLVDNIHKIRPSYFLSGMQQVSQCLKTLLQNHNISHGDITPENILVDESFNFYLIDFGISDITATLSQSQALEIFAREFAAPEKWDRNIPKSFPFKSDIYSIGKVTEWYFRTKDLAEPEDIRSFIDNCCQQLPNERIKNYSLVAEYLKDIEATNSFEQGNLVLIKRPYYASENKQLEELNDTGFKPKFDVFPQEENSENILVNIVSKNWYLHCLWVHDERKLTCLKAYHKEEAPDKYQKAFKFGERLDVSLKFTEDYNAESFILTPLLEKIQQKKARKNKKGNGKINDELKFYKELLTKEKEEIEKNSLRLHYHKFERKSDYEIHFHIDFNEKYSQTGEIKTHIDMANGPRPEEFEYYLSATADRKQVKEAVKLVGVAYHYDTKHKILKFKDCESLEKDSVPLKGYLLQNTIQQEEEKNRQMAAIRKVEFHEAQSMNLIHYLFNPRELKEKYTGIPELETVYQKDVNGAPFNYSYNQQRAIFNALHQKPLSVIQGPPGTGKTTVITEIVLQILAKEPNAKILISSQTNDAVDNVLDNLIEEDIPLVRLSGVRKPKLEKLKKHTLERKIEGWKQNVLKRANKNFEKKQENFFKEFENKHKNIFLKSLLDICFTAGKWKNKKKKLKNYLEKLEQYQELLQGLETESGFVELFSTEYGKEIKEFYTIWKIQQDWLAAVSSLSEHSNMNQKLIDSIRVIGATCNHIASKKYSKYNFEFDYVIMDESGKATIAESLVPLVLGENAILVGDHRQLRPMLTSNRKVEDWLRKKHATEGEAEGFDGWDDYFNRASLFENVITTIQEGFKSQLTECRRCSSEQIELISSSFYEPYGDEPIEAVARPKEKEHQLPLQTKSSIVFLNTPEEFKSKTDGKSSYNEGNAKLVTKLLKGLDQYPQVKKYSVGVITGYKAQLRRINKEVNSSFSHRSKKLKNLRRNNIDISVIDKFQGLEKDIIIFDLTRSCHDRNLGFLSNANRINVALSRQKKLVIIVGNYNRVLSARGYKGEKEIALHRYLKGLKKESIVNNVEQIF